MILMKLKVFTIPSSLFLYFCVSSTLLQYSYFQSCTFKSCSDYLHFFFKEYDTGVLVATVIGCVALLIAIVGIVYCCQRSQKTHQIIAARSAFSRIRSTLGSGVDSLVPEDEELDDFDEYKDNADEKEKGESDDEKYIAK